ncbi:MAG: hypothetical protein KGL59_13660, partial [Acidobacteriota bacterium]|nr:hypothetical protein [Acidobacteriota bacterium]
SRTGDWEEYLMALRLGVFDMVIPPYDRVAIHTVAYNALHECRVSRGARAVEALPHMPPRSALRAAAAQAAAYAGPGATLRDSRKGFGAGRERAADSLPGSGKRLPNEENLSSSSSISNCRGGAPGNDPPSGKQEADRSVSEGKEV